MEKVAYDILILLVVIWLAGMVAGMIAILPVGVIGLVVLAAMGLLFATGLRDRLRNQEDDYYSPSPECPARKGGDEWRGEPSEA